MTNTKIKIYDGKELIGIGNSSFNIDEQRSISIIGKDSVPGRTPGRTTIGLFIDNIILYEGEEIRSRKYDIVIENDDIFYVFTNCYFNKYHSTYTKNKVVGLSDIQMDCEHLITYTKERYLEMNNENMLDDTLVKKFRSMIRKPKCAGGSCDTGKMDMKDKAIRALRNSFEKQLKSIESVACRKESPEVARKRKELLDCFEIYLKELLVC